MTFCSLNTPPSPQLDLFIHLFLIYAKNELIITRRRSIHNRLF